jgi:hypothetical protein
MFIILEICRGLLQKFPYFVVALNAFFLTLVMAISRKLFAGVHFKNQPF